MTRGPWLGPLHALVRVRSMSGLRETTTDPASFTTGLSGARRARVAPRMMREWAGETKLSDPHSLATLEEMVWRRRGQALWLVTEPASVQNVLPPPSVSLDRVREALVPDGYDPPSGTDLSVGGTADTLDGETATSVVVVDGSGEVPGPVVPVVPGPVTASVYLPAGGSLELVWVDPAGVESSAGSATVTEDGGRAVVSTTTEVQSAARLIVSGSGWFTRDQLTYTPGPVPYVVGQGASKVHLGGLTRDLVAADPDGTRNLVGVAYRLREVG